MCVFLSQIANALGTAKGEHKECGVQAATLNEPMEERFKTNSIFLVALTKAKVYKTHGLARVVNGVDQNGKMHNEPNIGKDLRALDVGKWVQIPDDRTGGDLR